MNKFIRYDKYSITHTAKEVNTKSKSEYAVTTQLANTLNITHKEAASIVTNGEARKLRTFPEYSIVEANQLVESLILKTQGRKWFKTGFHWKPSEAPNKPSGEQNV